MIKKIPYGISDYAELMKDSFYYVDKTRFIETVEASPRFLFLIRPRRFGKSLWLNLMKAYYDVMEAGNFDAQFGETYIGQHPTKEKNSYLILSFNFSGVNPNVDKLEASFEEHCSQCFDTFNRSYHSLLGADYLIEYQKYNSADGRLEFIARYCKEKSLSIYLFIDEYDNFTNTILSKHGNERYQQLTHDEGFFRFFFNKIKLATTDKNASLKKIFITGVSPITLDDVTSGFNIAKNITNDGQFNSIIGFTEDEVITMLNYYKEASKVNEPIENLLVVMREWYNNYCFSKSELSTRMYNSDMVLHFMSTYLVYGTIPEQLVDNNIKIDYGKLRHLIILDKKVNGNFSTIKKIAEEGEIRTSIASSFPAEKLIAKENFVSLLYYFGILTIDRVERGTTILKVPNLAIRTVLFSYLVEGFSEAEIFNVDISTLAEMGERMAYDGDWLSFFRFFSEQIYKQTSVRDFIAGENTVKMFHLVYLNLVNYFIIHSEAEMGKGFSDLWLTPNFIGHPEMQHCYLVEFKYVKREQEAEIKNPKSALVNKLNAESAQQLRLYATDPKVLATKGNTTLHLLRVIYCGWELVVCEELL
jgi:Predicted AAA-ATPase/PD-(D/E)XK nuclease superfamily